MNRNISDGVVLKSMKKHRLKFLITEIILIVIFISFTMHQWPYISHTLFKDSPLDEKMFASNCPTIEFPKPFELHRTDSVYIDSYSIEEKSYWQNGKYDFSVSLGNVKKSTVTYSLTDVEMSSSNSDTPAVSVYIAEIGGIKTIVLTTPSINLKSNSRVKGMFNEIPLIVKYDIAKSGEIKPNEKVCKYVLDTRGIEMGSEDFDFSFSLILLGICLFLMIKIIIQFINPQKTPTLSQLEKYGEINSIIADIEYQIENSGIWEGKKIICDDWIISEDVFKLKVIRNHRKAGNFNYTNLS